MLARDFARSSAARSETGFQRGDHLAFFDRVTALHLHGFDDGFDGLRRSTCCLASIRQSWSAAADARGSGQGEQAGGTGKMHHFNVL